MNYDDLAEAIREAIENEDSVHLSADAAWRVRAILEEYVDAAEWSEDEIADLYSRDGVNYAEAEEW